MDKLSNYELDLAIVRDKFSIAMSTDPISEAINSLASEVNNDTELEVVLMEIHAVTTRHVKERNKKREDEKGNTNKELSIAEDLGDFALSQELRLQIGKIEEELLLKECLKLKIYTH